MARNTWAISTSTDNGQSWTPDGAIYVPNESVSLTDIGTQSKVVLADGSQAFVTPETKYIKQPFVMRWMAIEEDDAFLNKIRNYCRNQSYCKITDHNADTYIGKFISHRQIWLSGIEDTYDIEVSFERHV